MLRGVSQSVNTSIHFLDLQCDIAYDDQLASFIGAFLNMGIDNCVFGDISLEPSKKQSQDIRDRLGINAVFPLWHMNEEEYVKEFIGMKIKSVVKSVLPKFPDSMLERDFDNSFIEELKPYDASVCGENGEYHTFVYDGLYLNILFHTVLAI